MLTLALACLLAGWLGRVEQLWYILLRGSGGLAREKVEEEGLERVQAKRGKNVGRSEGRRE